MMLEGHQSSTVVLPKQQVLYHMSCGAKFENTQLSAPSHFHRLSRFSTLFHADKRLTVSVLGGSISAGIGAEDAPAWVDRLEQYLKDTYGKVAGVNVTVNNGAVPGTTSSYMAACVNLHIPKDADIVIIEYSVNDDWQAYPPLDNPVR